MNTESIILPPGEDRAYELGPIRGVFKADGPETQHRGGEPRAAVMGRSDAPQ